MSAVDALNAQRDIELAQRAPKKVEESKPDKSPKAGKSAEPAVKQEPVNPKSV